jgi:hypothetical protein
MTAMTNSITAQEGGSSQVPLYELTVDSTPSDSGGPLAGSIQQLSGPTPQANISGDIIVQVNYYNISADVAYSSAYIGSVIANYMMNTPVDGITLASLPIHLLAVSRGSAICDAMAQTLGQSGVWVDQETYLDPDPIAAQGDPPTTLYDNVEFSDDYWRNDGSASQIGDGHPVAGAYNFNLYWIDSEGFTSTFEHLAPAAYYIGTIDQTLTDDGDGPILSSWYSDTPTMPARDDTGWIYSDLVGAPRPLSGVWAASGGTGTRTPAGQSGTQWGNISDLAVSSGGTVIDGNSIQASYLHEDRGGSDTVTFYLDSDRNPYDGFSSQIGTTTLAESASPTNQTTTLSTVGVAPGTYWLCAQVTNSAGNTRYAYEAINVPLTVEAAGSITGEVANDVKGTGMMAAGDPGVSGVLVYVDVDDSGEYQPGDPSATTDANGDFTISQLLAGTPVIVREVVPAGTIQTIAPSGPIAPNSAINTEANFAITQTAQVGGVVALQNGADAPSLEALGGFKLILTEKLPHQKPIRLAAYTNNAGGFTFDGVDPAAKLKVQILKRKGFKLAPHAHSVGTVSVTDGQVVSTLLFSEVPIVPPTRRENAVH